MKAKAQPSDAAKGGGVAAVDRAFAILAAFKNEDRGLTLAEIAARTGLYKSTILRLAESLLKHRYLLRLDGGRFHIGPAPFTLGALYQSNLQLGDIIPPLLRELAAATGENVSFYTRDEGVSVCLFRVDAQYSIRQHEHEGDVLPLSLGSSGRILGAFSGASGSPYDRIREDHYYISLGERDRELGGISAPVFGLGQRLIGALSLGGPITRVNAAFLSSTRIPLLNAAIRATTALGGDPTPFIRTVKSISRDAAARPRQRIKSGAEG